MPLTDGFVTVRLRRDDDLGYIAAAADDPEGARWLDEPLDVAPKSSAEIADIWAGGQAAPLLIVDAVTDEPAGLINLQLDGADSPTVAYRIFPAWRGRGMAARALELVCAWAFGELGISRLALEIDEANVASLR